MYFKTMNVKDVYKLYQQQCPIKIAHLNGGDMTYRYYKNPSPKLDITIICFAGGTGLSDALFLMYQELKARYSFVVFKYPKAFPDNNSLADAVAELIQLEHLTNVYLLGQSYGGLIAQIIAKKYPSLIKGLILSSTCSLSNDITYTGMKRIYNMISEDKQKKNEKMDRLLPMFLMAPFMKFVFKKHIQDKEMQGVIADIIDLLKGQFSNDYFCLMDGLLGNLREHLGTHTPADFRKFDNEVLIISPDDDKTFTPDLKLALIKLMTNPVVITDFEGGHLALMLSPDKFFEIVDNFLEERN